MVWTIHDGKMRKIIDESHIKLVKGVKGKQKISLFPHGKSQVTPLEILDGLNEDHT